MATKKKSTQQETPSNDVNKMASDTIEDVAEQEEYSQVELSLMDKLKQEAQEARNYMLRTKADLENMKKRNQNIASQMYEEGKSDAIVQLLPIFDNLERAIGLEVPDEYRKGIEQIVKQKQEIFTKMDITELGQEGEEFDPNLHNALMQVENQEMSGKIVQIYQKGYKMGDKVLRHAGVVVAK